MIAFICITSNANLDKCVPAPGQHKQSVGFYVPCHSQAVWSLDKAE